MGILDGILTDNVVGLGIILTCNTCNNGAESSEATNFAKTKIKESFSGFQAVSTPLSRSLFKSLE